MELALLLVLWLVLMLWIDHDVAPALDPLMNDSTAQYSMNDVTIVIAFRNEEMHLSDLMADLYQSACAQRNVEIILVDDHSTDSSVQVIRQSEQVLPANVKIRLLTSDGKGKKHALITGLRQVKSAWVFLTDADCRIPKLHLERMIMLACRNAKEVVFAPVIIKYQNYFGELQALENINTQGTSEAFLSKGKPLMVNGANILLNANLIERYINSQNWRYPGGDDVFFAQTLCEEDYTYAYDEQHAVQTEAQLGLSSFINQRIRWVSKAWSYSHSIHRIFTLVYAALSLCFIYVLLAGIASGTLWSSYWLLWFGNWLIAFTVHSRWARKYGIRLMWYRHLPLVLVYPFYSLTLGLFSLIPLRFEWKARSYSNKPAEEKYS